MNSSIKSSGQGYAELDADGAFVGTGSGDAFEITWE